MGRKSGERVPRLSSLRSTPPHHIRMAVCNSCKHEAPLPVEALIKRYGENLPVEWAFFHVRCTACRRTGISSRFARLCAYPCPRFGPDSGGAA